MNCYLRSAAIGAATGGRMATGVAALALRTPPGASRPPYAPFAERRVKALVTATTAQEYVIDKLPRAPSRLQPAALALRAVTGAGAGAVVARRATTPHPGASAAGRLGDDEPPAGPATTLACAVVAGAAAVAGASVGARWRAWAVPRFGRDLPAALIEDAVVLTLAATATATATASRRTFSLPTRPRPLSHRVR